MAGGGFLHRVLQYIANEFIVERLANSHTFQRFAVRSAKAMENASQTIPKKTEQVKEQVMDFVEFLKSEHMRGPGGSRR